MGWIKINGERKVKIEYLCGSVFSVLNIIVFVWGSGVDIGLFIYLVNMC